MRVVAAALAGLVLGAGGMLSLQRPAPDPSPQASAPTFGAPATTAPPAEGSPAPPAAARAPAAPPAPPAAAAPVPAPPERLLLAWTPGGLPAGLAGAVRRLPQVERVTVVHGGLLELTATRDAAGEAVDTIREGFVVPLDAMAFDPRSYRRFLPPSAAPAFTGLAPGEALLSTTSARLRRLGRGGTLTFAGGGTLTVAGVVDDTLVGGAEVAFADRPQQPVPSGRARYLLLTYRGGRARVARAVRRAAPSRPIRLRGPGETPFLRHGDAVLPQAAIKDRFGEFSYRRGTGRDFVQDPAWASEHLETGHVPLLGRVRCHRALLPALRGALDELRRRNLGGVIDPAGFAGCHSARLTSSLESVSRHAWGVAVDLNYPDNPYGQASTQDPRLVEVLERWGFAWGGEWLIPDPAHFEYRRPPDPLAERLAAGRG